MYIGFYLDYFPPKDRNTLFEISECYSLWKNKNNINVLVIPKPNCLRSLGNAMFP